MHTSYASFHYCKNGLIHREDGPAREWTHGIKEWWLNGIWINKQKRKSKVEKLKKGRKQKVLSK